MQILTVVTFLIVFMLIAWLLYLKTKLPSIADVAWPLGLFSVATIYLQFTASSMKTELILGLLFAWTIRLGGYLLFTRLLRGNIDKRYVALSQKWSMRKNTGFLFHYQLQGSFIFIIAMPFLIMSFTEQMTFHWLDQFALVVVLVGIIGETIADMQLARFKKKPGGTVCNTGLWHYSRHPNYFFELMVWFGFSLMALTLDYGYFALLSPVTLFLIMRYITGPITETCSLESRGEAYKAYQEKTPMIFPWFK